MVTIQAHTGDGHATIWVDGEGGRQMVQLLAHHPAVCRFHAALAELLASAVRETTALEGLGANR